MFGVSFSWKYTISDKFICKDEKKIILLFFLRKHSSRKSLKTYWISEATEILSYTDPQDWLLISMEKFNPIYPHIHVGPYIWGSFFFFGH